jgi:subtilisin-like proprotein convertase family protein/Ca2+-binding RTX toxin-like protein
MVAGVMAAAKNGTGAVGVAYNSSISEYKIAVDNYTSLPYMLMNDVSNNSWAFTTDFGVTNLDPQTSRSAGDLMLAELKYATKYGRGGDGVNFVAGAGNSRASGGSAEGSILNNSRYAIEVGAINQQNDLSTLNAASTPFSSPGASVLVSAPGSNITSTSQLIVTDQGSIFGSNYSTLQGTSLSTPIVSGIVALMLQANSNLTYRDVQAILALSAKQFSDPITTWLTNDNSHWNGTGMHYSYDYGFGEVDALAASRLSETWLPHNTGSNESSVSGSKSVAATISAGSSINQTITMASGISVEHAEIDVSLTGPFVGSSLTLTLTSPNGTQSVLMKNNDAGLTYGANGTSFRYTFMSTQEWGELSAGNWQLTVQDTSTNQPINFNAWNLRLYGAPTTADDIYYYTNEYVAGGTLSDTSAGTAGGKNTINAAAVTGNTSINLSTGAASIGGKTLTISSSSNFNNIFAGDGNDTLVANNNLGILDGGRGTNTLTGGIGQNLFVVRARTNGLDTITNFTASQNDKIDLVGFIGKSFSNLSITQQGADAWVGLGNGQKIILKNTTAGSVSSSAFVFQDTFVAPKIYTDSTSSDNTFVGSSSTISVNSNSDFNNVVTNETGGQLSWDLAGTVYQHDMATSDRFVVSVPNSSADFSKVIRGFKPGIDKIDLSVMGISSVSELAANSGHFDDNNAVNFSRGTSLVTNHYVTSDNSGITFLYLEGVESTQLTAADFIFANGQAGSASTYLATTLFYPPDNRVPLDTNGASDPNVIGSNNGVTFNGTTSISSSVDYALPDTVNNLILIGSGNIVGTANNNGDYITSNTGADTLVGGLGNDTYIINNSNDVIVENTNSGTDSVLSSVSFQLDPNVENLTLTGTDNITGTCNNSANVVVGNSGNDTLTGGGGNDSLSGGSGNDTYVYSSGWGSDTISDAGGNNTLDLSANNSTMTITLGATTGDHTSSASSDIFWTGEIIQNVYKGVGDDTITGTSVANYLNGGGGNDSLVGAGGNDTLDGGLGNDTLVGGTGDDLYCVDSTTDVVVENASEGTDKVLSSANFTLSTNVENLTLVGSNNLSGAGNSVANVIVGNYGNDTLFGASGSDSLSGGTGNDMSTLRDGARIQFPMQAALIPWISATITVAFKLACSLAQPTTLTVLPVTYSGQVK